MMFDARNAFFMLALLDATRPAEVPADVYQATFLDAVAQMANAYAQSVNRPEVRS